MSGGVLTRAPEPNMSVAAAAPPYFTPARPGMSVAGQPLVLIPDALRVKPGPTMSTATQLQPRDAQPGAGGSRTDPRLGAQATGVQPGSARADRQTTQAREGQSAPASGRTVPTPGAGMPLVQAARAARSGAATADPESANLIDQIAPPAPLNIPVIVPLAPAALPNVFTPPASLNASDLHVTKPPQRSPGNVRNPASQPATDANARAQQRRILSRVVERYAETRRDAETAHRALIQQGDDAVRSLVDTYYQVAQQIPGSLIQADAQLQSTYDAASSQIITAAESADQEIVRQFNAAKRALGRAHGGGLKAVKANADSSAQQIATILTGLTGGYLKILSDAALEGESTALEAYNGIDRWKRGFNASHPIKLEVSLIGAMNEAWQKAVAGTKNSPGVADERMGRLSKLAIDYQSGFTSLTKQVEADIVNSVKPSLQAHADRIGTDGVKNVNTAHSVALDGLRRQTRAARDAVADMRRNAVRTLHARRQAVRGALEVESQQAMAAARHEASSAVQSVSNSLAQSLPHYGISVERYHTMLAEATDIPPESLQSMAEGAGPSVIASLIEARTLQATQLDTTIASVRRSVESRLGDVNTSLTMKVFNAAGELQASAFETSNSLNKTAEAMTAGFSAVSDGVNAAVHTWSMPLSKAFEGLLKQRQAELDKNKEEFQQQINKNKNNFLDLIKPFSAPDKLFEKPLEGAWTKVSDRLGQRVSALTNALDAGIINKIDEGGVTGALRGLTAAQGYAMRYQWEVERGRLSLEQTLLWALDAGSDDYHAAINYLNGNTAAGARFELEASMHWYNDEEDRIKAVMRSLTPEQLAELHGLKEWAETEESVRSALDETELDINVFDALNAGDHFLAQAYEEKDAIDNARKAGDEDALIDRFAALSQAPDPDQYGGMEIGGAERREGVVRAFARIQGRTLNESGQPLTREQAADVMLTYATRPIEMIRPSGGVEGGYETYTQTVGEHQTELARALLQQGEGSVQARSARVIVELNRPGGAKILNLDTALHDPRLDPSNTQITPEQRQEALAEREQVLHAAAETYSRTSFAAGDSAQSKAILVGGLHKSFTPESTGARLAEALVNEPYPTPATAAIAMEYGMEGSGTREELLNRFTQRMNRDELQEMRRIYDSNGRDLYAELGIFGHGRFGELSGDDRLLMERNFLGVPRNDKERYEVAQFAMQQQRDETGGFGGWLASGSLRESELEFNEARMRRMGGPVRFVDGLPVADQKDDYTKKFDDQGTFKGDAAEFSTAVQGAKLSAESYAAKVDQWSNFVTNAIAIAGMVVAAIVTVATGGLASPLLMGAIALGTGLLAVGANYALKGGRYGWEQAFTDIGMAAVQALTAGVGQKLSLLGKAGRLTSSAFGNKLIIGTATSALNSVGQTALSEQTYEKGAGGAANELLFSLFRGVVVGGVTTTATHGLESLRVGPKLPGTDGKRMPFGDMLGESTSHTTRAAGKALTSGVSGFVGKETELGLEAARGRYKGDAGDAFVSGVESGLQSAFQGAAEGGAEASAQRRYNARQQAAAARAAQPTQPEPTTTRPPAEGEPRRVPEEEPGAAQRLAVGEEPGPTPAVTQPEPPKVPAPDLPSLTATRPVATAPVEGEPVRPLPLAEAGGGEIIPRPPEPSGGGEGGGARLPPTPDETQRTNDILEVMLTDIQQKRQMAGGAQVDDEFEQLPQPQEPARRGGEGADDRTVVSDRVSGSLRSRARRAFGRMLQDALEDPGQHTALTQKTLEYLTPDQIDFVIRTGRLPEGFDFDHFLTVADFPEFAHRPEVGTALPREVHREAAHGGDTTRPREAATMLEPEAETRPPFRLEPEAAGIADPRLKPREQQIAEGLAASEDIDRDILIEQRAELTRMQEGATAARNLGRPNAALERRIEALRAGIDQLEQQMAARPAPAGVVTPAEVAGTAAGISGSRFRGDALDQPRADIGIEVEGAVRTLLAEGSTSAFSTMADNDPTHLKVRPATGGDEVTVRIIPTDTMAPEPDGMVPVARYRLNPATGVYEVFVSSRAPHGTIERALAHELTEIRARHQQVEIPDALKPGGFGSGRGKPSDEVALSPHDRGRIAELEVLTRRIADTKDAVALARLQEDTQRLLAHLGVIDDTPAARARLEVIREEVAARPTVLDLLNSQVKAAQQNPFLRVPPSDPREYVEFLADRLAYAQGMGDAARSAQVLAQARLAVSFRDRKVVRFHPPGGEPVAYGIDALSKLASDPNARNNRRARALVAIIDDALAHGAVRIDSFAKRQPPPDPAMLDSDTADAVRRRYSDQKLFQDWATFKGRYGITSGSKPDDIRRAFHLWASGYYVSSPGRPASLAASSRVADITPLPYREVVEPRAHLPPGTTEETTLKRIIELQAQLKASTGLAEREAIADELAKLPSLKEASENIGTATANNFARTVFGVDPEAVSARRGAGVPDLMFIDPKTGRLIIVEAKGGESSLTTRRNVDGDKMVAQGTKDYLESLAKTMQQSRDPEIRLQGKQLEDMLAMNMVDYYLVRQPYGRTDGTLETPTVARFDISRGGTPRI
jgi:hypothetical protein